MVLNFDRTVRRSIFAARLSVMNNCKHTKRNKTFSGEGL